MSSFGFIRRQVRISELKEIVSYRGGTVPTALDPAFDLGSSLYGSAAAMVAAPSSPKASASSPRASASSPTAANRQQLRDAVSSLSLYVDHVDDHVSPLSSPAQASANAIAAASHTSRIAAATRQLIHTLSLEDGSRCPPSFAPNSLRFCRISRQFSVSVSAWRPPTTLRLPAKRWQPRSNLKADALSSRRSAFPRASNQWQALLFASLLYRHRYHQLPHVVVSQRMQVSSHSPAVSAPALELLAAASAHASCRRKITEAGTAQRLCAQLLRGPYIAQA
jgi:hypothetical protein